jgi:hypothetical protein
VHEFRPLNAAEMRRLLTTRWTPPGVTLPEMDSEAVASVIRITGGNFRLFQRLLTQIERIAEINNLNQVSNAVVDGFTAVTVPHIGGDLHFLVLVPDESGSPVCLRRPARSERCMSLPRLGHRPALDFHVENRKAL